MPAGDYFDDGDLDILGQPLPPRWNGSSTTDRWKRRAARCAASLLEDLPGGGRIQAELEADPHRVRFVIVFDRKGTVWGSSRRRGDIYCIACIMHDKHPKDHSAIRQPRGPRNGAAQRRAGGAATGRSEGRGDRRPQVRGLGAGDLEADREPAPGEPDQQRPPSASLRGRILVPGPVSAHGPRKTCWATPWKHFAIDLANEDRTEDILETKRPVVNSNGREKLDCSANVR